MAEGGSIGRGPIAVITAVEGEATAIEASIPGPRKAASGGWMLGDLAGRPVVLLRTGIGTRRSRVAAEALFRELKPAAALAIGFGGGLRDDARAGDIVIATEVIEPPPPDGEGPRAWPADAGLLALARERLPPVLRTVEGRIVSTASLVSTGAAKRALGKRHQAHAVDMESSGIARAANAYDVPTLYARAIVDDVDFDLPPEVARLVGPDGRVKPLSALGLLVKPSVLKALPELRRRSTACSRALAALVISLLPGIPLP